MQRGQRSWSCTTWLSILDGLSILQMSPNPPITFGLYSFLPGCLEGLLVFIGVARLRGSQHGCVASLPGWYRGCVTAIAIHAVKCSRQPHQLLISLLYKRAHLLFLESWKASLIPRRGDFGERGHWKAFLHLVKLFRISRVAIPLASSGLVSTMYCIALPSISCLILDATYHEGRRFSLACFLVCLGSTVPHTHHCRSMQNSCHCPTSTYLLESTKERRIFLVNESSVRQSDNTHVHLHVHTQCLKSLHRSS